MNSKKLVKSLNGSTGVEREKILDDIARINDPKAVKMLLKKLLWYDKYFDYPDAIFALSTALGEIGDQSAVETLIKLVVNEDDNVRKTVALALEKLGDNEWIQAVNEEPTDIAKVRSIRDVRRSQVLINYLGSDKLSIKKNAVKGLCQTNSPKASPALIELLSEENKALTEHVISALQRRRDPMTTELLLDVIKSEKVLERAGAAKALLGNKDYRVEEVMLKTLDCSEADVVEAAARYFRFLKVKKSVEPLITLLSRDEEGIRLEAASSLDEIGDKRATDAFIKALNDSNWKVREIAAGALGRIKDIKAVGPLIRCVSGYDSSMQLSAVLALGEIGSPKAVPAVVSYINSNVGLYAMPAMDVLEKIKDPEYVDTIISVLSHHYDGVKIKAIEILGDLNNPKVVKPICDCCDTLAKETKKPTPGTAASNRAFNIWEEACATAKAAFLKIKAPEIVEELAKYRPGYLQDITETSLVEPMIDVLPKQYGSNSRYSIAFAFLAVKDPRTVEPLIKLLDDKDKNVRIIAAQALGEIRDLRAAQPLKKAVDMDKNRKVKKAAQDALDKLNKISD